VFTFVARAKMYLNTSSAPSDAIRAAGDADNHFSHMRLVDELESLN
jgi:hypothetical protein